MLGASVGVRGRAAVQRCGARREDDAAFAGRDHDTGRMLRAKERAYQVDAEDSLEIGLRVVHRARYGRTRNSCKKRFNV